VIQPAVLYLLGILGLSAVGVAGVVALEVLRPDGYNTAAVGQILAILTPTVAILVAALKSVQNGQAIQEVKETVHEAKAEVQLAVAESARAVADSVAAPGKNGLP
jgi:hypothetical protein